MPSSARAARISSSDRGAAELLERHAEIDDLHLAGRNPPRVDHEVRRALRHRDRDVGDRLERGVRDLLKPRRVGQVGVLVKDGRKPPHRAREPPERRRAVAVQVKDVDLLAIDDLQERRQRRRIELRLVQVGDVDAERFQRFL